MDAATMTKQVADAAQLDRDEAQQAIEATLRTLAERVTGSEAEDLVAQLPMDFQAPLQEAAAQSDEGERYGREEFVQRVGNKMGADDDTALRAVKAVFETMESSISSGEWGDLLAQLPTDYDQLFTGDKPSAHNG